MPPGKRARSSVPGTVDLVGVSDVDEILSQTTRDTRELILDSHNLGRDTRLKTRAIRALCAGLDAKRAEYGSEWGLRSLTLHGHGVTDKGVRAVLAYAARDPCLQTVYLRRNPIEFRWGIDEMVSSLNSSHIVKLTLRDADDRPTVRLHRGRDGVARYGPVGYPDFPSDSLTEFFDSLNAPHIATLDLGLRSLSHETIHSIIGYISSPRSRNMRYLYLTSWDEEDVSNGLLRRLTKAIGSRNFSLFQIDHPDQGNESRIRLNRHFREAITRTEKILERNQRQPPPDARVRTAALRYLSAARVLLNARPGPPLPPPAQKPYTPPPRYHLRARARPSKEPAGPAADTPFRLFDLPPEIYAQIYHHISGDPGALSRAQLARLRREAEGKEGLRETVRAARGAGDGYVYEWLRWAGVDSWEEEKEVGKGVKGDEDESDDEVEGGGEDDDEEEEESDEGDDD